MTEHPDMLAVMSDDRTLEQRADPSPVTRRVTLMMLSSTAVLAACGGDANGGGGAPAPGPTPTPTPSPTPTRVSGPAWLGFGRDPQHTAASAIASQDLTKISWTSAVDLAPQYTVNGDLLTHYGSPVVTTTNTVLIPVKTTPGGGYGVEGRNGASGTLIWQAMSDYVQPPHNWLPPYNLMLTAQGRLYAPGAGGKLLMWVDAASGGAPAAQHFLGAAAYDANAAALDASVFINTPLTADASGNVFFGFMVTGTNPAGLTSGIARVAPDGSGIWVSAAAAAGDASVAKPAMNCAPAISTDGSTVYLAVNRGSTNATQTGLLLALNSTTLATRAKVALKDPTTGTDAHISDDSTASPVLGPDGRVFYGVLESQFPQHNARGWLLQFDALLNTAGVAGSFGWDVSPSVIPAAMVPSYNGPSTYLLAQKYNNYTGVGTGDGLNRLAVLDPKASQADTIVPSVQVMREVMTVLGPTLDGNSPTARREWCINTMASDPPRQSLLANNEDGVLYRWDLTTNTLSQNVRLNAGLGEAYTPTVVGPDGAVYAISNATLYSVRGS